MGNGQSQLEMFDPSHIRIYKSLLQIQNPRTRAEMLKTLMAGAEYINSARRAGIYSHLLAYIARVNSGEKPAPLPFEAAAAATTQRAAQHPIAQQPTALPPPSGNFALTAHRSATAPAAPSAYVAKGRSNEKAMNYFQNCLLVLGLEEEVALTESALRAAYKKAAVKAHPDKGGSEQEFEAVTRAHAYLGEILRRINGGRSKEGVVEAPTALKDTRAKESKDWEMVEPVRLNPKKLDMDAFNKMFEQTRIPDPDDEGYGDWLKSADATTSGPKFGGKFNRDVFNRMFEDEARKRGQGSGGHLAVVAPQAMVLAPTHGVELGRTASSSYTAPANASMKYTDLRQAYTVENTISDQVADVRVESRSFDAYSASRKKAPDPLTNHEMEAIAEAERLQERRESQRRIRAAEELSQSDEYFRRMKQLVLTGGAQEVGGSSQQRSGHKMLR